MFFAVKDRDKGRAARDYDEGRVSGIFTKNIELFSFSDGLGCLTFGFCAGGTS
jgi:hypothetical protein